MEFGRPMQLFKLDKNGSLTHTKSWYNLEENKHNLYTELDFDSFPFESELLHADATVIEINGKAQPIKYAGSFVVKTVKDIPFFRINFPESHPSVVLVKHRILKNLGQPVCPTFRFDGEKSIIMTDIRCGNRYKVYSRHNKFPRNMARRHFYDLSYRLAEISESAYADGNGVYLGQDAYTVLEDTSEPNYNNRFFPFLLDLGIGSHLVRNGVSTTSKKKLSKDAAFEKAQKALDVIVPYLDYGWH